MVVGIILFILGVLCCSYGYISLGGGQADVLVNDYHDIDVGSIGPLFALFAGVVCTLTGILGMLTAKFRYATRYWMFSCPYIVVATACGIFMLFLSIITSGFGNYVENVTEDACAYELESGETISERIQLDYTKLVDRNMCSQNLCECPTESTKIWTSIPEDDLREYGRISSWADATEDEFLQLEKYGQFDAKVAAFHFADTEETVNTYRECYENYLDPMFKAEQDKPESDKDP